jgi:hypothetical protein
MERGMGWLVGPFSIYFSVFLFFFFGFSFAAFFTISNFVLIQKNVEILKKIVQIFKFLQFYFFC